MQDKGAPCGFTAPNGFPTLSATGNTSQKDHIMGAIDSDAHVIESPITWEYADEADQQYMPKLVSQTAGPEERGIHGNVAKEYWLIDNRVHFRDRNLGYDTTQAAREMQDIDERLAHMDELEIDMQVLYPTLFLRPYTRKAAVEKAMVKSYNRWLAEIWKKGNGRLRWVAMASFMDMNSTRDEIEFAKDNGACGIFMRGLEIGRRLTDPYFYPLFELAEELDLAICHHAGNGSYDVHDTFLDEAGFSKFKLPVIGTVHSLILEQLSAKFPKVRWGFIEVSSQWIPYVLNDLSLRFKKTGREFSKFILADNNVYVACQVSDDIPHVIAAAGDDNLVIGTDYGHHDTSTEIEALRKLKESGDISEESVNKILFDNAKALYGI